MPNRLRLIPAHTKLHHLGAARVRPGQERGVRSTSGVEEQSVILLIELNIVTELIVLGLNSALLRVLRGHLGLDNGKVRLERRLHQFAREAADPDLLLVALTVVVTSRGGSEWLSRSSSAAPRVVGPRVAVHRGRAGGHRGSELLLQLQHPRGELRIHDRGSRNRRPAAMGRV
eukprot:7330462-Pyramimonas_sp.AAC.1